MSRELANHLWQSTLCAVVAGLPTLAFRRHEARVRYWLWMTASLTFLLPLTLLFGIGSQLQWAPATLRSTSSSRRSSGFIRWSGGSVPGSCTIASERAMSGSFAGWEPPGFTPKGFSTSAHVTRKHRWRAPLASAAHT